MSALIFDIRRYSIHDGPGIRTTIFFKGCPMRCRWCHNPESQEGAVEEISVLKTLDGRPFQKKLAVGSWQLTRDVMREIDKDAIFYAESGGGVTFSGGEPMMQPETLKELLLLCNEKNYHTAIDTCGYAEASVLKGIMEIADLWLFDLKLMDDSKHLEYTGVSNDLVLKNLEMLANAGKQIIIRLPLIPGITDGYDNLEGILKLMKRLNLKHIDLLPYHSIARDKYKRLGKEYTLGDVKEINGNNFDEMVKFFDGMGFTVGING